MSAPVPRREAIAERKATWAIALIVLGLGVLVGGVVLLGEDPPEGTLVIRGSSPAYESVENLVERADLVVEGSVEGVSHRQVEETTDIPFAYIDVTVDEVRSDRYGASERNSVVVSIPDLETVFVEGLTPLLPGQRVMLFLERITAGEAPEGLIPYDEVFVPLSDDNGIFDVLPTGEVVARS